MKKNKDQGFTLIELLATIVILALVVGITVYSAITYIGSSKEKTYSVTINSLESNAGDYLTENSGRLFYVTDDDNSSVEYQCLTVKNLIDYGYFKNDILDSYIEKDRKVSENDYIYIERDISTKTITKHEYIIDDETLNKKCNIAVTAFGDISITTSPSGWTDHVDVTINYKIRNANNINDYEYLYSYSKSDAVTNDNDNGTKKTFTVSDNGTISASIKYTKDNTDITTKELVIDNIDNEPPKIEITGNLTKIYQTAFDLYEGVTITDNSGEVASKKIYFNNQELTDSKTLPLGDNTIYYEAIDKFGNTSRKERIIKIVLADTEFNYKEEDQIYQVYADGTYIIETYGAKGGNNGGDGGYVKAEVVLNSGETLIINTGGMNGYNGGGAYGNGNYYPGGGATTVRLNGNYLVIAGGGGARGNEGTPGLGGSGNGAGGADPGNGAGLSGTNGGGGSNSNNYSYSCNCQTCGGGCARWNPTYSCNCQTTYYNCNCKTVYYNCNCYNSPYQCNCQRKMTSSQGCAPCYTTIGGGGAWCMGPCYATVCNTCYTKICKSCSYQQCESCSKTTCQTCGGGCAAWNPTYSCNCQTCTNNGKSGQGGANKVATGVNLIEQKSGIRNTNGYAIIRYKIAN